MTNDKEEQAAADASGGEKRKRKSSSVEPRTPLKRQRIPVQKFQSPAEEIIPIPSTSKQKDVPEMLHKKGCFLGVRGDEGTFYLCKTVQNVFTNTRKFKIQWLDLDQPPDVYKIDFLDTTDADCILTNVKMDKVAKDTYRLPAKEQKRVEDILTKALKKERGEPIDDVVIEIDSGEDDEEEEEDWEEEEEPSPKKAKSTPKARKGITVSLKGKGNKTTKTPKSKQTKSSKAKDNTPKKSQKKGKEEKKKGPDRNLQPNPKIKVLEKDPFFETKDKVDFISKTVQGKLAIRAVLLKDMKLLNSLMEDQENCYRLDGFRSIDVKKNALHYALERNDKDAVKALAKDFFCKNERREKGTPPTILIEESDRGDYNPLSLGVAAIRAISQSRGSKQGNDAFTQDSEYPDESVESYFADALNLNVSMDTLNVLLSANPDVERSDMMCWVYEHIYVAVLKGNRKLAGKLVEEAMKEGASGFGFLHKDVLLNDKEDLRQTILAASVKKKAHDNKFITPLHCAAINPNVQYLTRLLQVEPDINLEDKDHRRPIHFAAVCEGVAPLEFLLQRGASPMEVDNQGRTPLHYACTAGRPRNVDILLKKAKEASAKQGDMFQSKWGVGGVDKPSRSSYCPIHIAVTYGHADVVKILIKHQVDINRPLSAGKNKVTPLMIAASQGSLEIARILIQNGAAVEQPDKLKRTALTHAVMNGHTTVTSYLLNLGANPNSRDTSGNSVVHYAAAYGWYFPLKLLLEAGGDPTVANLWQTVPVGIAFLKSHIGIVDYLLKQPKVDINFTNDAGMTLASVAASSSLEPGLYSEMEYLIKRKKADPTIRDGNGLDTLHHLARNKIMKSGWGKTGRDEDKMALTVKIAKLLLDAGCDPTSRTDNGTTALMMAIEQLNIKLVELLVEHGGSVTSHKSDHGKTILHLMADQCMEADLSPLLKILVEQKPKADTKPSKVVASKEVEPKTKTPVKDGEGDQPAVNTVTNGDNSIGDEPESKKGAPEPMEVDGKDTGKAPAEKTTADMPNGDVNGMEVDEQPLPAAPDEKTPSSDDPTPHESQEDIWPLMAAEVDDKGATPLLAACRMYRDFKKGPGMNDAEVKRRSQYGRNFMKALIDLTGADVSATIKQVPSSDGQIIREEDKYTKERGGKSVVHLLLHVGHEILEDLNCAGLELVLSYKPQMEHRDEEGKTALILAVESNSDKALRKMIDAGAEVNVVYGDEATGKNTPLHFAAKDGNANIVKMLLEAKADVKVLNSKTQDSPLHMAVQYRGDEASVIEIVGMLLAAGADINCGKTTPLHSAVLANLGTANASTELEEFMIAKGANVFARDEKGRLPLHYAFITKANPKSTSALDPVELCSVLTDAMDNKQLDVGDDEGRSPLHMAVMRGATICCVHLLQRGVSVAGTDKAGYTALALAVENRHDSCAIMLIQRGADVETRFALPKEERPDTRQYHTTMCKKKKPIWVWLPTRLAEPVIQEDIFDIYKMAISGELQGVAHMVLDATGLAGKHIESALRVNKYHIVLRHLHRMKDAGAVAGYTNKDKQNLLHILALYTQPGREEPLQLKVAKVLVEKGVSLNQLDSYGRYPLNYLALKHHNVQLAKFFMDKCPSIDLKKEDIYARTVMSAYFWDQEKIYHPANDNNAWIKQLMGGGASLDVSYTVSLPKTPLFDISISDCPQDFFGTLSQSTRTTPLISALYNSDFGLVKFLLCNGASPNLSDEMGVTPLMHAVRANDRNMVKLLLNYEFDPTGQHAHLVGSVPLLRRKLSRQVFALRRSMSDPDSIGSDEVQNEVIEEEDDEENDIENDEENEGSIGAMEDDVESDHDTDVVDEEEEEEDENDHDDDHLPLPRLGSKQLSLKRAATSLGSNKSQEEFHSVEKTSEVNLKAQDSAGWSVIHHLVCPLEYGTYDNEELLYILHRAGAPLDMKNLKGETPLQMALQNGATRLAARLQNLLGVEAEKQETPSCKPFCDDGVRDDPLLTGAGSKYSDDAEEMVKAITAAQPETKRENKPKVDKSCMAVDCGDVVYDDEKNIPYDVLLSKIEVRNLLNDTYNFYKMQIIRHKGKNIYILFTKWGRIGDEGMNQQTPYQELGEAVKEFCKIFKSKTGNTWANLKEFKNQPKKYRLVERDNEPYPVVKVDFELEKSSTPSRLPDEVQDLLREMADVKMMHASMTQVKIAEEYLPFGRIKRNVLIEARKILQKVGELVLEVEQKKRTVTYDTEEHQANCEQIARLSSEFFSMIPMEGYAYDRVGPLNSRSKIKSKMSLISCLLDLEVASKMLLGAQHKIAEINPLDYVYQAIGCSIEALREDDVESQYILKYIRSSSTGKEPKVLNIFRVCRVGEEERLKATKLNNHRLLWHGSSMANFMSILHRGLLVAPPEAPMTGHAFGEGIYLADSFAKSCGYANNYNPKSQIKLALLCEVALGNCKEDIDNNDDIDLNNSEYNSLKIRGQNVPDQDWDLAMPYGAIMPMGNVSVDHKWTSPEGRRAWLPYSEYIVQNSEQICLRYLVQFV